MAREVDRRKPGANRTTPGRSSELRARASATSEELPGAHTLSIKSFDVASGNPSVIASEGAPAEAGNFVQRALSHAQSISTVLGLEETQSPEFVADPNVQFSSSGAATVHLQQQYKGIRIFQAAQGVRFGPDGAITEMVGNSISVAQDLEVTPRLTVQEAVLKAAGYVAEPQPDEEPENDEFGQPLTPPAVALDNFTPKVIATFASRPEIPTVLEAGPFADEIKASLIWFPLNDGLQLAWEVLLVMPDHGGQYRTLVNADDGEILYCRQLLSMIVAEGKVFVVDGSGERQDVRFPRPLADYGVPVPEGLPGEFPDHWVASSVAGGNTVTAVLASTGDTFQGADLNGVLRFNPPDPQGNDQLLLNIFYYNCFMHDFLYMYGFREADGNFQQDNFGRGGFFSDPVLAFAHAGPVTGTANMSTRVDGTSPTMNMGLVAATNRHTALDSTVVFHEYMHGVTNRLVGGPLNTNALEDYQSAGMGEGWGDYIACTINKTTVVGAWVTGNPGGIRKFPYDGNFPDHFGMLGTGRYNRPELNRQHAVGEIWCAALMEMNRRVGNHLGVQLVVDALKLSPVRPSFLDMRDSILKALDNKLSAGQLTAQDHEAGRAGIWAAFAQFGMGPNASSNGASLAGVVPDFNVPAAGVINPANDPAAAPDGAGSPASPQEATAGPIHAAEDEYDPETRRAFDDVKAAIRVHGEELIAIPNVVSVRPAYRIREAKATSQPALTVTVLRKLDASLLSARELIPAKLGKVVVDVRPATPLEQLRFLQRRQELARAGSQSPAGIINERLPAEAEDGFDAEAGFGELLEYVPPSTPLAEVEEEMTVVCHASPDAGWRNLRSFIEGAQERLTATMYEFNARHILDALIDSLDAPRRLRLILDGGDPDEVPGPSQSTVSKARARRELENTLSGRFECVWAPVRQAAMTTAYYYPYAYHIKVAVRDGNAFWLSSGNWKESGQPRLDPIEGPLPTGFDEAEFENTHNREWHVVVHNQSLAALFETFITHDIEQAKPLQLPGGPPPPPAPMPDLFVPAQDAAAAVPLAHDPDFFRERAFTKKVRVQPLMTPDNFPEHVLPLIRNAQRSIYFQNQSLKPSPFNARYTPLFRALRDKTRETVDNEGLEVKILVSEFTDLQLLIDAQFEMSCVRQQLQCHNKGIIIDDEIVIVGSHNWTGPGATSNRDASLIFYDSELAAYFKKFFLYDWNRVGDSNSLMLSPPLVAMPGEPTPAGMKRVAWADLFPDWRAAAV